MIGASRERVSTRLNQLRRTGLLSYTREFICINDLEAFRRLAAGLLPVLSGCIQPLATALSCDCRWT